MERKLINSYTRVSDAYDYGGEDAVDIIEPDANFGHDVNIVILKEQAIDLIAHLQKEFKL